MSDAVIQISISPQDEEKFKNKHYTKVQGDLNSGTSGKPMLIWYKKESLSSINRIQFSFRPEMEAGLTAANFFKIDKNLNAGTDGDQIFLWYMSGTTEFDVSIVDLRVTISVTEEPGLFKSGWERLGCDLNRSTDGDPVYLWVKRNKQTYISDIRGSESFSLDTDNFNAGFFRVDEDTNLGVESAGASVFLWYQHTTDADAHGRRWHWGRGGHFKISICAPADASGMTALRVSCCDDDERDLKRKHFVKVDTNLHYGKCENAVYLWYKPGETSKIQYFTLLVGEEARKAYMAAGCNVVEKNLNNCGTPLYIAYQ
ncbi:hypothetical protein AMEX_G25214 [Astyanax mexicanus]|uniref:Uncharacterized protein n=1 Tax=Astyanax mexicanus TaxID=7994 RepID=A0A8T2KSL7_ASTMX|nr:hypothetical protein AMEX_G25214 [Astyanax mexicanus]